MDENIREHLRHVLGRLASIDLQRRYIVNGDDCYLLPCDLIESAGNNVERILKIPALEAGFSPSEVKALKEFYEILDREAVIVPAGASAVTSHELIENEPHWATLRQSAQECMARLGLAITFEELEKGVS